MVELVAHQPMSEAVRLWTYEVEVVKDADAAFVSERIVQAPPEHAAFEFAVGPYTHRLFQVAGHRGYRPSRLLDLSIGAITDST